MRNLVIGLLRYAADVCDVIDELGRNWHCRHGRHVWLFETRDPAEFPDWWRTWYGDAPLGYRRCGRCHTEELLTACSFDPALRGVPVWIPMPDEVRRTFEELGDFKDIKRRMFPRCTIGDDVCATNDEPLRRPAS